jgi:hypothetical protein
MTDLSAISSSVKDINGNPTALIRFSVRDTQFEFDANLGIVKQEKKTGEVWLFVPTGTKRLTISHPHLGILRGYKIPLSIMGKNTYDAEIEITNKDYLQSLYTSTEAVSAPNDLDDIQALDSAIVQTTDSAIVQTPDSAVSRPLEILFNDSLDIIKDAVSIDSISTNKKVTSPHGVDIYAGLGFNAISIMGPAISLGINFKHSY